MDHAFNLIADQIRTAAAAGTRLRIRAGGSKDFYGNLPRGEILDPRNAHGIVSYEPTELAMAVRCGTSLAEVAATLDAQGQMLAFEPPHFGAEATIGGCIAAGLAGPRRASYGYTYGGVRDFVLGAKLINGRGQLLSFGGMVMKNVAGYDVARLLAGSLGVLGVIVEVSLKVVPKPQLETTLRFAIDETPALNKLNEWSGQPLPISASTWVDNTLYVRLSGAPAAIAAAIKRLGGECIEPNMAITLWQSVREHTHPFFTDTSPLWRLSLPSTAASLTIPSQQLIEWNGALRWLHSTQPANEVRAWASKLGGYATLFRGGNCEQGVFTPLAPGIALIHQRLRAEFDPAGIFDAGRMLAHN